MKRKADRNYKINRKKEIGSNALEENGKLNEKERLEKNQKKN